MKNNIIFTALILCFTFNTAFSQKKKKWNEALDGLKQSEFITTYKEYKDNIETRMASFHQDGVYLSGLEFDEVGIAYMSSKERFDKILDKMKVHFCDKDTRKMMTKNADLFLNGYRYDLDEAYKFYLNECKALADIYTNADEGQFIAQLTMLLAVVEEFYGIYSSLAGKMKNMTEEYFENNFAAELRLKEWAAY